MNTVLFGLLLGTAAIADAGPRDCERESQGVDAPLLERCADLAGEPTFEFPISRRVGVPISYTFEASKPEVQTFGFMIAKMR